MSVSAKARCRATMSTTAGSAPSSEAVTGGAHGPVPWPTLMRPKSQWSARRSHRCGPFVSVRSMVKASAKR